MARIKKRISKGIVSRSKESRPTRQEAELAAQNRINQKEVKLPEYRGTLQLRCSSKSKPKIISLDYQSYAHQFPKLQSLIHQLQVALELWARKMKSQQTVESKFYAQKMLFQFLYEKGNETKIGNIASITAPVLRRFLKYLQDKYPNNATVKKYFTGITSVLRAIYKSKFCELPEVGIFTGKFPVPPRVIEGEKVIPALDQRSFNELVLVLQQHFDVIKSNRKKVKALLTDGNSKLDPYKFRPEERKRDQTRTLSLIINEHHQKYPDFPLGWDVRDSHNFLRHSGHIGKEARYQSHPANELFEYLQHLRHPLFEGKQKGLPAFLFYIYPTIISVSICLYLLKVQTGWNLTVLLRIEFEDNFEDMFKPCPLSQDYVLIASEKARGVFAEKYHRTKKNNKYGAYKVLKYLWEFGKDLREHTGSKSPWEYLKLVFKQGEPITNTLEQFTHHSYSKDLCSEGLIHDDNGQPLKGFAFESIRKNIAHLEDELSEYDIRKLASVLQNSPDVAATHYRNKHTTEKRLRESQASWVHHFTYFQGSFNQGVVKETFESRLASNDDQSLRQVQIITTDGITPVSVCKNPFSPDWYGHQTSVGKGERCSFFSGCSNCGQSVVFTETLPFIHKRLQHIDQLRSKMNVGDWENSYHIEWHAWKEVLEQWPSQEDVVHAEALSRTVKLSIRPQLYGVDAS